MNLRACLFPLLAALGGARAVSLAEGIEFFEKKIRPVLVAECYECHAGEKQKGGLRVDSREALRTGGSRARGWCRGSRRRVC